MNSKTNHSIDLVVEANFIIIPKLAYAFFFSLDDLNILLLAVVHNLRPTPIDIIKN